MIISRDIINRNIQFQNFVRDEVFDYAKLCGEINRIKRTLLKHGARKGDKLALAHHHIDLFHSAAVFAVAELGMQLLVIDMPATVESLPYCKMALSHPVKFTIYDGLEFKDRPLKQMLYAYSQTVLRVEDFSKDTSEVYVPWTVSELDPFFITSSSGTTNWSKRIVYDHREVYQMSKRNASLCGYTASDRVTHSKNLHHGASLIITFLPAFMTCDTHMSGAIADYTKYHQSNMNKLLVKKINDGGYNRFMIPNMSTMELFFQEVEETIGRFDKTLIISIYVFTISDKLVNFCKKYNVEFVATYGSIDAFLVPLTAQRITKDSPVIPNSVGPLADDFYEMVSHENGVMSFMRPHWPEPKAIHDNVEILEDGTMVLKARILDENHALRSKVESVISTEFAIVQNGEDKYLALFENLKEYTPDQLKRMFNFKNVLYVFKDIFFAEAKLNYDALRGHFIYYDKQ